jgi:4-aminobutyrate aminotransferase / (S)-3-amino-2-methylpropionate transaminase / 5-aminovalerate transaminase
MRAIELVKDRGTREPAKEATTAVSEACYRRGLVTITAGTYGNVIRVLMPLVVTDAELEVGLDVLEASLAEVAGRG